MWCSVSAQEIQFIVSVASSVSVKPLLSTLLNALHGFILITISQVSTENGFHCISENHTKSLNSPSGISDRAGI